MNMQIEINEEFQEALNLMENTDRNVFITGRAGVGKSTLLTYFRHNSSKKIVVLAPTGVSALNIGGETIHSFFGFKPYTTIDKIKKLPSTKSEIYKKLDTIVIDEISMVRADLLDYVDVFLRKNGRTSNQPFGGIQMIFIGDLYQLPPVVTNKEKEIFKMFYPSPYFFDSNVFRQLDMEFIELDKIYRQKDKKFIEILNAIRNNTITEKEIDELNKRVDAEIKKDGYTVYLTPLNESAFKINEEKLRALKKEIKTYYAVIAGRFDKNSYPADFELKLAEGSQIMFLNNDLQGRWVNGTLGIVRGFEFNGEKMEDEIIVETEGGDMVSVLPNMWDIFHYKYNPEKQSIETEILGSFSQYPLKLAWALTIHKSQGKTYKNVIIDLGKGSFAAGQTYVALSRCVSLDGITLKTPVKKSHIMIDWRIVKFLTEYQYKISEKKTPLKEKIKIIQQAIKNGKELKIVYLKTNDQKTKRTIKPIEIKECQFKGVNFTGLIAYCHTRKEKRTFRLERILEIME